MKKILRRAALGLSLIHISSDVSESLTSFTLTYEVKTDKKNSGWASPVSFGWNDWTATKWATFQFSGASDMLRYSAAGKLIDGGEVDSGGKPIMVSDIDGHTSAFWGYEIGAVSDDYHKITLTAEVGEMCIRDRDCADLKNGYIALAPSVLLVSAISVFRGWFQGENNMLPPPRSPK